ncbi:MAG: GNAT family N-acetyltransferase [Litoreibacter sp.]
MEKFTYKTVTPDHAAAWRDLRIVGVRDFPLGFLITPDEAEQTSLSHCRDILKGGTIRGVYVEEQLVGFCGYRPQKLSRIRHRGEVGPFFVSQRFQGTGAAKVLMQSVMNEARNDGLAQLELFVDTENYRAIAFYERFGFAQIATYKDSLRLMGQSRDDHFYILRLQD